MIVAVETKAAFIPSQRVFMSSDNATTKLSPSHSKVQDLLLETTQPTTSLIPSQQIKRSKSRQRMSSSSSKRRFRSRKYNYPSKLKGFSTKAFKRDSNTETTTPRSSSSMETSSPISGWPKLKDVMVTNKNNHIPRHLYNTNSQKSRHLYKTNSLVEEKQKISSKTRKRLKRRRRILERKVHNRTRKLIKQKLKIKSRIKNNSIVRQKSQKMEGHQLPNNIVNSHVGSTTSKQVSSSSVSTTPKPKVVVNSYSKHRGRKVMNRSKNSKNSGLVRKKISKPRRATSLNSHQTATTETINQDLSESNDSMLADEAPHILSGLEPEVSMMDYAWNEDKIEIDFKTGKKLVST